MAQNKTQKIGVFMGLSLGIGTMVGIWACMALFAGLASTGWSLSEMLRQYLVATGSIKEFETLVDFYTHIKGVEYIICVAFLGSFPLFFKYLNKAPEAETA